MRSRSAKGVNQLLAPLRMVLGLISMRVGTRPANEPCTWCFENSLRRVGRSVRNETDIEEDRSTADPREATGLGQTAPHRRLVDRASHNFPI